MFCKPSSTAKEVTKLLRRPLSKPVPRSRPASCALAPQAQISPVSWQSQRSGWTSACGEHWASRYVQHPHLCAAAYKRRGQVRSGRMQVTRNGPSIRCVVGTPTERHLRPTSNAPGARRKIPRAEMIPGCGPPGFAGGRAISRALGCWSAGRWTFSQASWDSLGRMIAAH